MPAATRTMNAISAAVAELGTPSPDTTSPGTAPPPRPLAEQLERWQQARVGAAVLAPAALHLSVLTWTRLHGIISLEIEGVFASMGLGPDLLFDGEVEQLVTGTGG